MKTPFHSVDDYIHSFPKEIQSVLKQVRLTILNNAPMATEGISYGMPAYKANGKPLVYFAAFAKHIGFYATPSGHAHFSEQLSQFKQGKGSVQFPLSQRMPYELIAEIVRFRVDENNNRTTNS